MNRCHCHPATAGQGGALLSAKATAAVTLTLTLDEARSLRTTLGNSLPSDLFESGLETLWYALRDVAPSHNHDDRVPERLWMVTDGMR